MTHFTESWHYSNFREIYITQGTTYWTRDRYIADHIAEGWYLHRYRTRTNSYNINLLKPSGHVMHEQVNTATTVRSAHTVFMCFVFIWEQTATGATYSINWLVFITKMKSVYSAVRTGSLNKAICASSLKVNIATTVRSAHTVFMCFVFIWEQTATCATYSIIWLVFITEMEIVYSAVRTGSLNKAVCASSLKVDIATTVRSAHTVFMCFVFIW